MEKVVLVLCAVACFALAACMQGCAALAVPTWQYGAVHVMSEGLDYYKYLQVKK